MSLEIFWGSGSPFSWRVLLALEWKRIPYQSRRLEFSKGDHRSPDYLAVNPRGQVPALRDGDFVLYESIAMLAYLDRKYPEPPLFGVTPEEHGRVWQAVQECVVYIDEASEQLILPLYFGQVAGKEAQIRAAMAKIHDELGRWERALVGRSWLVLDGPSAADFVLYPTLKSGMRAASKPAAAPLELGLLPLGDRYPRLQAWMQAVEALPGYDRTYPPHWRP